MLEPLPRVGGLVLVYTPPRRHGDLDPFVVVKKMLTFFVEYVIIDIYKGGKKEMKQRLKKDMQLIADLGNEYKEKERDAKKVAEEKRTYGGSLTLFKERTEEEEQRLIQYCEKEGQIVDEMNIIDLAIQITKNNIDLSLNEIVEQELIPIIKKYKNKRIGKKTKEKIGNEIKEYIKDKYNFIIYFNMFQEYYFNGIRLSFDFYTEDHKKIGSIEKGSNEKEYNEQAFDNLYNWYGSLDYNYINDVRDYAKTLYIEKIKSKKKIDDLRKQIDDEKNNINKSLRNHLTDYKLK